MSHPGGGDSIYALYLSDLGHLLKEQALRHKAARDAAVRGSEERTYLDGLVMGYYSVISLLQQQADSFKIDRVDLRLEDIDPDRDLL